MTDVIKLLALDAKCRYEGITGDVYSAHQLSEAPTWNYTLPTLVNNSSNEFKRNNLIKSNIVFRKKFFSEIPFLNNIDLSNILIAGGSVRSILVNSRINDIDIFIYGIKDIDIATKRIEKFILDIRQNLNDIKTGKTIKNELEKFKSELNSTNEKQHYKLNKEFNDKYKDVYNPNINTNIDIYSNGNTITIIINNKKLQIILRLYNTISEILHGFDLGSSSVGFDGSIVYFTSLSKFCFENMVNILDTTRRSTTYEVRLIKYFEDGFNIILPNLDISKLRTNYHKYNLSEVCELPYMKFSYTSIKGNSIQVHKFFKNNGLDIVSDYDFYANFIKNDSDTNYPLLHYNLSELITGKNRFVIKINFEEELSILKSKNINIDNWKLNFNKLPLDFQFIEFTYNKLIDSFNDNNINKNTIQKYISVINIQQFVVEVYLSDKSFLERKQILNKYIQLQKNELRKKLDNYVANKTIWITQNAGTQLTSSINPIIENLYDWYSDLYITNDVLYLLHNINTNDIDNYVSGFNFDVLNKNDIDITNNKENYKESYEKHYKENDDENNNGSDEENDYEENYEENNESE
jgi:hypothetical protein